jgi:hypothetical protein
MLHARYSLDQHLYVTAEIPFNFFLPVFQILGHCMQNSGSDRFIVHVHADQDRSRAQSVLQQRCAGQFDLSFVEWPGQFAGVAYHGRFCGRKSFRYAIKQGLCALG